MRWFGRREHAPADTHVETKTDDSIDLTDIEKKSIRAIEVEIVKLKCEISDLQSRIVLMQTKQADLLSEITDRGKVLVDMIKDMAVKHGIDVNDSTNGKWSMNTEEMKFVRQG